MRSDFTILFDFGNTLAAFNDGEARMITADLAEFFERRVGLPGGEFTPLWLEERDADFRRSAASGVEHDFGARVARVFARTGRPASADLQEAGARCVTESFLRHVHVDPEVGAAVRHLAGRMRLGVLSNYLLAAPIHGVLRQAGMHGLFDRVIVSREVGFAKPHPRCFQAIVEALSPPRGRTVYVGDDFEADVLGATRAGLLAVWTWALREPRPVEPDMLPAGARCTRSRDEYLAFLKAPEEFLGLARA